MKKFWLNQFSFYEVIATNRDIFKMSIFMYHVLLSNISTFQIPLNLTSFQKTLPCNKLVEVGYFSQLITCYLSKTGI